MINENLNENLIELQTAHVNQYTISGVRGDWFVEKNITNERLHTFSPLITDEEMSSIMDFARKYELEAFNIGIKFQKQKQNKLLIEQIDQLKKTITELANENDRLAIILEKHIGE